MERQPVHPGWGGTLATAVDKPSLRLAVADTGAGVEPDRVALLFEAFPWARREI